MDILEKLFGGPAPVKVMRLFLLNPEKIFDKPAVSKQAKLSLTSTAYELNLFEKIGFIKSKSFFKEGKALSNGKAGKKKRVQGYLLNAEFKYIAPLQRILVDAKPMEPKEILRRITPSGKVMLIVISGLFLQEPDTRLDLLIVGDYVSEQKVKNTVSGMEAEIGRQIRYAVFDTNDFKYRMALCDRLIRDVFDYPHEVVVDKIGL